MMNLKTIKILAGLFVFFCFAVLQTNANAETSETPKIKSVPKNIQDHHLKLKAKLHPNVKKWIEEQTKGDGSTKETELKKQIQNRFSGQNLKSTDLEQMLFLMHSERTQLLTSQLEKQIQGIKQHNDQIKILNEQMAKLKQLKPVPEQEVEKLKKEIEKISNTNQMDMLRLQALSNKRKEAFEIMTNFIKKMSDSRASIIGNLK